MDTQNQKTDYNQPGNKNRVLGGMFLLFLGAVFILRETNFIFFPYWLFTWPMILIAVGVYTGIKHGFRGPGWLILLIIGGVFLIDEFDTDIDLHRFIVPGIIIAVGLMMILRPKRNWQNRDWNDWGRHRKWNQWNNWNSNSSSNLNNPQQPLPGGAGTEPQPGNYSGEDFINSTSVLGGTKRVVVSKNFKGADITCFMGGAEIDLTQADINGTVVMDITLVMGGAKIIVPTNWEVKCEASIVLGSLEDKRQASTRQVVDFNKVLVIKGTTFMGGIELKNY